MKKSSAILLVVTTFVCLGLLGCGPGDEARDCTSIVSISDFQELIENGLLNPGDAVSAEETTSGDINITLNTCVSVDETDTTTNVDVSGNTAPTNSGV